MKIKDLNSETRDSRARISATVAWEDCDRPAERLFFETDIRFADALTCNPHAFLIGRIMPAMFFGEKRLSIDTEICPELWAGLDSVMNIMRHWHYSPDKEIVKIEAKKQNFPTLPITPPRAGCFFSGGIDAFATLRANHLQYPNQHPGFIRDGLLVFGLELDQLEAYEHVIRSLTSVAQQIGITLIPVYTNIYLTYRNEDAIRGFRFWIEQFQGSAFAAIGHAFAKRLTTSTLAASLDIQHLLNEGSHPLIDPNYSSSDFRIHHEGADLSRMDKTRLIADWDPALNHLRVCNIYGHYRTDRLNCGNCEKCIRTMLAFLSLGVLEHSTAFPQNDVDAESVLRLAHPTDVMILSSYQELILPLARIGRHDLARALRKVIARYDRPWFASPATWHARRRMRSCLRKVKNVIAR